MEFRCFEPPREAKIGLRNQGKKAVLHLLMINRHCTVCQGE